MILPAFWNAALTATWTAALVNHLWQSTVVTLIAWLLALTLRRNQARTRYWVWMIASVKFLVPFALLIAAGEAMRSVVITPVEKPAFASVIERLTQPFSQTPSVSAVSALTQAPAASQHGGLLAWILVAVWLCGLLTVAFSWARSWWKVRALVRASEQMTLVAEVPVLSSPRLLEPGVFGILHPVLLLPENITDRLSPPQLNTIIAHEMCHVRRRDNLTAAIHMLVEAIFWFHPAVWWIKARLLEERERACDEAVLQSGNPAHVYAESILNVCKFYVESPPACMAGVTGSDLKRRIVRIMSKRMADEIGLGRRLLLITIGVIVVTAPVVLGLVHVPRVRAQSPPATNANAPLPSFEVATIKPHRLGDDGMSVTFFPQFSATGITTELLILNAFHIWHFQVIGGPGWIKSDRYDVKAKIYDEARKKVEMLPPQQASKLLESMIQSLLVDRFNFKFHRETKEFPVYALVVAKNGFKLHEAKSGDGAHSADSKGSSSIGKGHLTAQGMTMSSLADDLSGNLRRTVLDKTGLTGKYDLDLKWTPDPNDPTDSWGPPVFTALQEQLGLKLVAQKGPVEIIVIDHIDKPSAN